MDCLYPTAHSLKEMSGVDADIIWGSSVLNIRNLGLEEGPAEPTWALLGGANEKLAYSGYLTTLQMLYRRDGSDNHHSYSEGTSANTLFGGRLACYCPVPTLKSSLLSVPPVPLVSFVSRMTCKQEYDMHRKRVSTHVLGR
jgi:hypothetical protein